jgi:hypothetical protein
MYAAYRQHVLNQPMTTSRPMNERVTASIKPGTHRATIIRVDVLTTHARIILRSQYGEMHAESVEIAGGSPDRISWNLWRLLSACLPDRSAVFSAKSRVLTNPDWLATLLTGHELKITLTWGPGYRVDRTAENRYWLVVNGNRISDPFDSHSAAASHGEDLGYRPATPRVGRWERSET